MTTITVLKILLNTSSGEKNISDEMLCGGLF